MKLNSIDINHAAIRPLETENGRGLSGKTSNSPQLLPLSQYGERFDAKAILNKKLLNKEFVRKPIKKNVAIVWYRGDCWLPSHAAISVNGKLFGFLNGRPTRESKNLESAIKKVESGTSSTKCLHVQYLNISPLQQRNIEIISDCNFFPGYNCIDAVSRALDLATSIKIPYPFRFLPDASRLYLQKLQEHGCPELQESKSYGISSDEKMSYISNVLFISAVHCFPVLALDAVCDLNLTVTNIYAASVVLTTAVMACQMMKVIFNKA
jgi:hypothetical protein